MENDKLMNEVVPHLSMRNVSNVINAFSGNMEICYGVLGDSVMSAPLSHAYQSGGWFYLHGEDSDADDDLWNSDAFRLAVKAHILKTYFGCSEIEWAKLDESFDNLMARINMEGLK